MLPLHDMSIDSSPCQKEPYTKPSALNISFLLCKDEQSDVSNIPQQGQSNGNYSATKDYIEQETYVQMIWSRHQHRHSLHSCTEAPPLPCHLLSRNLHRSSRQHLIESQKIEQELLSSRRQSCPSFSSIYSSSSSKKSDDDEDDDDDEEEEEEGELPPLKAKRRRASSKQLEVLNKVFCRTFFPSTQLRAELGRQLGMSPRTVQIWFQNKRQAIRAKEQSPSSSSRENSIALE